jgi:hypothetical protein
MPGDDPSENETVERRPPTIEPTPREGPELRRARRRKTDWKAYCRHRNGTVHGQVLDITAHGAFFAPDDIVAVGEALLAIAEKVALRLADTALHDLELPARIRWIGYSLAHGRLGFGVEFSHQPLRR